MDPTLTRNSSNRRISYPRSVSASASGPSGMNSSSSRIASSIASGKSRHAEPVGSRDVSADASLSMPASDASARSFRAHRPSLPTSRPASNYSDSWTETQAASQPDPASTNADASKPALKRMSTLPQPSDLGQGLSDPIADFRSSLSDTESRKRISVSSSYSVPSIRGIHSSQYPPGPGSASPSEGSLSGQRSGSGIMSSSKGLGPSPGQSESGVSNVTVTTSSNSNTQPASSANGHQLTTREAPGHANPLDLVKRNPAPTSNPTGRTQPTRSRSRAKRRFSGSTANSSHSPSSERTANQTREREEHKPAPWGIIGVCALDSKARSKPSRNILNRIIANREFDVVVFGDKTILDEEVENWPICDYLISFYSDGFPLEKAINYVKARKPFCVNDVSMQKILWDRRLCLQMLDKINVPTPKRLEVNRDGGPDLLTPDIIKHVRDVSNVTLEPAGPDVYAPPRKVELLDDGDILSVDGALLKKPFVEKPTSGEDHNIIIYFPKSAGGGARKLFRKIGNKSSEFVQDLTVPRAITEPDSSFLYEKFMQVDHAEDVKAYTVGPDFCHAETRKSPVVDGIVKRNTHGKEVRYVTKLEPDEQEMAAKIANTFGQRVCGFDLLRAGGKGYVIDVNGWSFVKDNEGYYDKCSSILKDLFKKEMVRRGGPLSIPSPAASEFGDAVKGTHSSKDKDSQPGTAHSSQIKLPMSGPGSISEVARETQPDDDQPGVSSPPQSDSGTGGLTSRLHSGIMNPLASLTGANSVPGSLPATAPPTIPTTPAANPDTLDPHEEAHPTPPPPPPKHSWKLKGMVSVIRHADRTPKQKYKFTFHTAPFIELLKGHQEEVLLIGEAALTSVIEAVDIAMKAGEEDKSKLKSLRNVLVKKGNWPGTKIQIKPMFRMKKATEMVPGSPSKVTEGIQADSVTEGLPKDSVSSTAKEMLKNTPDEEGGDESRRGPRRQDSMSGVTMSKFTAAENSLVLDKLQLIVKWGGEPTHSARYQSQELASNMRNDYLLLNRDILDEVHVFSSSERRVTTSAQIWAATFLDKKEIPDDFITIRKDLLDDSNAAKDEMDKVKKKLKGLLRKGNERPTQFTWPEGMPEPSEVQTRVVQLMNFHRRVMQHNYNKLYSGAVTSLNAISNPEQPPSEGSSTSISSSLSQANAINSIQARWCSGEDAELFRERWEKLFAEFCDHEKVDPSKISELYDTMKFDALHNRQFLEWVFTPPRQMLEEEFGITLGRDGKTTPRETDESNPKTADDKSDRGQGITSPPNEKADRSEKLDRSSTSEMTDTQRAVKRIFRRKSWLRHSNEAGSPEHYFHLYKAGNGQTKAKTDARFEPLRELYQLAKVLFDFICPQEYGISDSEKLEIGLLTSLPLLKEIVQDLEEMQASDEAKSFFYFTKESHIYTLLNCILEGGIETKISRQTIPELDYLSQICFELYESENKGAVDAPQFNYSIRITISPGCHVYDPLDIQLDSKHCIGCAPRRSLTPHGDWKQVIETLRAKFHQVKLPKTFLAINLSEAFTFQEKERHSSEADALDQTATPDPSGEVLEMKRTGGHSSGPKQSTSTDAFAPASLSEIATAASNLAGDASQTPLQLGSALPPGRSNADADRSEATETPEVPQV